MAAASAPFNTPERNVPLEGSNKSRSVSPDIVIRDSRRSVRDSAERVRRKKLKRIKKKKKKKKKTVQISTIKEIRDRTPDPSPPSDEPNLQLKQKKSKRTLWVEKNIEEFQRLSSLSNTPCSSRSAGGRLQPLENEAPRNSGFIQYKGGRMETPKPVRFMDDIQTRESRLNYRTTRSSRNRRRGLRNARQSNEMYESQKIHSRRSVSRTSNNILPETKDAIQSQLRKGEALQDVTPINIDDIEHREAINYWREFRKIRFYRSPTVTRVIGQILQTVIPEIGVTYQTIIDEFLGQSWPISIFLHGGLLRDIMTSTVGNDVDITFSCSHYEMQQICEEKGWKSEIREDIPYWVVGGASHFETKLEGFPLSFNGLAPFHVQDFASNTIYYDCKNNIIIDRYGKGVDAALRNQISLPVYSKEDWEQWKNCDFVPGVKMYRFYKFVCRGFNYDIEEAKFIQGAIAGYVAEDQEAAVKSCYHALRELARGQDSYKAAVMYKEKLKRKVVEIYVRTYNAEELKGREFWETYWEKVVDAAIAMGDFHDLELYEADPSEAGGAGFDEVSDQVFQSESFHNHRACDRSSLHHYCKPISTIPPNGTESSKIKVPIGGFHKQNSVETTPSSPHSATTYTSATTTGSTQPSLTHNHSLESIPGGGYSDANGPILELSVNADF